MGQKKECVAMLLAGGQGSRLGLLTRHIAKPAVSFGGKYRIIDFSLSNCTNSGIDIVGVLTQYKPLRLNTYIGLGTAWDLDAMSGGLSILPPYVGEEGGTWYPLLISPEDLFVYLDSLKEEGADPQESRRSEVNSPGVLAGKRRPAGYEKDKIHYPSAAANKEALLRDAYARFQVSFAQRTTRTAQEREYQDFRLANAAWLEDYALFQALRRQRQNQPWPQWEQELRERRESALAAVRLQLREEIEYEVFVQFIADRQYRELRVYANERGLKLMGDIPILVAADSADCWAHQEDFWLEEGRPTAVSGVPPDYFSEQGRRWGTPLYRWETMAAQDYPWWRLRFERALQHFDLLRLDHFRGFEAFWRIDASEATAVNGLWMKGPGRHFFESLSRTCGPLPLVAEDLGYITPEVEILKQWFGYLGMKVLPFALPDLTLDADTVAYTGTHDNDTLQGWLERDSDGRAAAAAVLVRQDETGPLGRSLIEHLYASKAGVVILPVQDILGLDSRARMNVPGSVGGNWEWCLHSDQLTAPTNSSSEDLLSAEDLSSAERAWAWLGDLARRTGRSREGK